MFGQRFLPCGVLGLAIALTPLARGETTRQIAIEPLRDGPPPNGFTPEVSGVGSTQGRWRTSLDSAPTTLAPLTTKGSDDRLAPVISRTGDTDIDNHFDLLVYEEPLEDFTLSLQFKINGGSTDQMAGVAFRLYDSKNYYVARASAKDKTFRFYKYFDGLRGELIGPDANITVGVWTKLKVVCEGSKISIWLADQLIIDELEDPSFPKGKVALWTKSDTQASFRDIELTFERLQTVATQLIVSAFENNDRLRSARFAQFNDEGELRVIASSDPADLGKEATRQERDALENENRYYGKSRRTRNVILPFRDRNGEPIASLNLVWRAFPGETEKTAITRAVNIADFLERQLGYAQLLDR